MDQNEVNFLYSDFVFDLNQRRCCCQQTTEGDQEAARNNQPHCKDDQPRPTARNHHIPTETTSSSAPDVQGLGLLDSAVGESRIPHQEDVRQSSSRNERSSISAQSSQSWLLLHASRNEQLEPSETYQRNLELEDQETPESVTSTLGSIVLPESSSEEHSAFPNQLTGCSVNKNHGCYESVAVKDNLNQRLDPQKDPTGTSYGTDKDYRVLQEELCTICLRMPPKRPVRLPCDHVFCERPCLLHWIKRSSLCPNCRNPIHDRSKPGVSLTMVLTNEGLAHFVPDNPHNYPDASNVSNDESSLESEEERPANSSFLSFNLSMFGFHSRRTHPPTTDQHTRRSTSRQTSRVQPTTQNERLTNTRSTDRGRVVPRQNPAVLLRLNPAQREQLSRLDESGVNYFLRRRARRLSDLESGPYDREAVSKITKLLIFLCILIIVITIFLLIVRVQNPEYFKSKLHHADDPLSNGYSDDVNDTYYYYYSQPLDKNSRKTDSKEKDNEGIFDHLASLPSVF
ncbi:uncharacterized protein LOC142344470 isoform X2 [Convolutriloba macropyga]|uniref:uncharacterized protein LOC142344470 isoform X2 n=1 Tax=Convolutriloba macropyga TaxID=536237 RepID=UPI003F51CE45